jgi:hypothetical protein
LQERAHPIHYVIATLLVVNLALTAWLLVRQSDSSHPLESKTPTLPAALTDAKRTELFADIQARFNAGDPAGLYTLFDEFARGQLSEADAIAQLEKLRALFGPILSGSYSHYEFVGSQGERSFFNLFYNVTLSSSQFPRGQATVAITSIGNGFGLIGFRINTAAK